MIEYILDESTLEVQALLQGDIVAFLQDTPHTTILSLINEIEREKDDMVKEHLSELEDERRDRSRAGWNY